MVEDPLKEGIAVPVKNWHVDMSCIVQLCPLCAADDPDELCEKLMEDGWRTVSSGYCHDDQIDVNTKARKVNNEYHGANLGMEVFALDLCMLRTSMLFSVLAIMSCICLCSTMHAFF